MWLARVRFYCGVYRKWITRTVLTDTLNLEVLSIYINNEGFETTQYQMNIQGATEVVIGSLIYPRMVEVFDN